MKKRFTKTILYTLICCLNNNSFAQLNKDSLEKIWKNPSLNDSIRLDALSKIAGNIYIYSNPDSSFLYADTLELISKKVNNKTQLANALNLKGISLVMKGNYHYAIDYFNKSLKISEEINDKNGIANSTNSLGIIYQNQGNYHKALEFFKRFYDIKSFVKDTIGMANALSNMAITQSNLGNFDEALSYHLRSIHLRKLAGDKIGLANSYANIGNLYQQKNKNQLALEAFLNSLALYKLTHNAYGQSAMYISIGNEYYKNNELEQAEKYADSGLVIAFNSKIIKHLQHAYELKYHINKKNENYENALDYFEKAVALKDSLNNDEKQKILLQKQYEYEYEKKEAVFKEEQKQQKLITLIISLVLIFIVVVLLLVFINLRQTQKQKLLIEYQKKSIEQKQKEILDSIEYAKRIQLSLLTSEKYIDKVLKRLNQ